MPTAEGMEAARRRLLVAGKSFVSHAVSKRHGGSLSDLPVVKSPPRSPVAGLRTAVESLAANGVPTSEIGSISRPCVSSIHGRLRAIERLLNGPRLRPVWGK